MSHAALPLLIAFALSFGVGFLTNLQFRIICCFLIPALVATLASGSHLFKGGEERAVWLVHSAVLFALGIVVCSAGLIIAYVVRRNIPRA